MRGAFLSVTSVVSVTRLVSAVSLTVLLSASCAGSISGEVDGDSVPSFTTSALAVAERAGSDAVGMFVYFASAGDACTVLSEHFEIQQDEEDPEEETEKLVELYEESTPEKFWYAVMAVFAEDPDDLEEETEVDLEDFDEDVGATFTVCRREGWPEEKDGFLDLDDDCFVADEGVLLLTYREEDSLAVGTESELELEDEDGDNAGDITMSGTARYCESLSELLQDSVDDAPPPPVDGGGECTFSSDCQLAEMSDGPCASSTDCGADARCVEKSNGSGACVLVVDDAAVCDDAGLNQSFFTSVEGTSVATCVSFDSFCDGGTCVF